MTGPDRGPTLVTMSNTTTMTRLDWDIESDSPTPITAFCDADSCADWSGEPRATWAEAEADAKAHDAATHP